MGQESTIGHVKRLIEGFESDFICNDAHAAEVDELKDLINSLNLIVTRFSWHLDRYVIELSNSYGTADIETLESYPLYIGCIRAETNQGIGLNALYFESAVI